MWKHSCDKHDGNIPGSRDLKMRERQRQVKRHLKSEFGVFQSSSRLVHLAYFVESTRTLLELNS